MLWLTVDDPAGGSFAVPVKTLVSPPPDIAEYAFHNQIIKSSVVLPPPTVKIVVECDFDSEEFRRMLDWYGQVVEGLVFDYKRTGSLIFSSEEEDLAGRPVYGMWPSVLSPDSSTLRMTITLVCDLVGEDLSDNPITFAEGVSEAQKAEIEQALTPKGAATLARYGVQLVED